MNEFREVDALVGRVSPCGASSVRRTEIVDFLQGVIGRMVSDLRLLGSGSSTSRTYLPVSDIDLVLLHGLAHTVPPANSSSASAADESMRYILSVFQALCLEVAAADNSARTTHALPPYVIRNVEFINARTKVVHCVVNNIGVDITINQPGAVSAAAFVEECDRLLGQQHLLKRSLLLVKVRSFPRCLVLLPLPSSPLASAD